MNYQHDTIRYVRFPWPVVRTETVIRYTIVTLVAWACTGGTFKRGNDTPLDWEPYRSITWDLYRASLREKWQQPFSGCAYLWHWALECAGLGAVHRIGRTGKPDNPLTRIAHHVLSEPVTRDTVFASGDMIQIGEGLHTHLFGALASNAGPADAPCAILGGHYGQEGALGVFEGKDVPIGGWVKLLSVTPTRRGQLHGKREAHRVLRVSRIIKAAGAGGELLVPEDCVDFWRSLAGSDTPETEIQGRLRS